MSGQQASVCAEHADVGAVGCAVLVQLALASYPDGTCALRKPLTVAQLEHRTKYGHAAVEAALRELQDNGGPVRLERLKRGGRETGTLYRVVVAELCACRVCQELRLALESPQQVGTFEPPRTFARPRKSPRGARKSPREGRKSPRGGPTTVDGDGTCQGGAIPHRESSDAPAPSQSAGTSLEAGPFEPASGSGEPVNVRIALDAALGRPGRPPAADDPYAGMTRQEEEAAKRARGEELRAWNAEQEEDPDDDHPVRR